MPEGKIVQLKDRDGINVYPVAYSTGSGGGGAIYTAGEGIDIENDVITNTAPIWHDDIESSEGDDYAISMLKIIYPVGSIYMNVNNINPSTFISGTTWVQIKDKFLLSAGDIYEAGDTGGEATHTLTIDELPSHNHESWPAYGSANTSNTANHGKLLGAASNAGWLSNPTNDETNKPIKYTGGGQPHNNMPPYLVIYMWERTE